jgi:hypothetical protein
LISSSQFSLILSSLVGQTIREASLIKSYRRDTCRWEDGHKNWLFFCTEFGAEYVGKIQSLLVTCRLHGINPYTYFVDVLQRVSTTKAADVADLTPVRWQELLAQQPLKSDLEMQ